MWIILLALLLVIGPILYSMDRLGWSVKVDYLIRKNKLTRFSEPSKDETTQSNKKIIHVIPGDFNFLKLVHIQHGENKK